MRVDLLLLVLVCAAAAAEIPMAHRRRTPQEGSLLLEYLNRSPLMEKVVRMMRRVFPSDMVPNIYAYPEVKIANYLGAQYYG